MGLTGDEERQISTNSMAEIQLEFRVGVRVWGARRSIIPNFSAVCHDVLDSLPKLSDCLHSVIVPFLSKSSHSLLTAGCNTPDACAGLPPLRHAVVLLVADIGAPRYPT